MEGHSLRSRHRSMEYENVYTYNHKSNLDEIETFSSMFIRHVSKTLSVFRPIRKFTLK